MFKTRVLQESGVSSFIERMEMYKKYEINNWTSIKRPKSVHPFYKIYSGAFRLTQKQNRPFAILLFSMLCLDFIAFLIDVYATTEKFLNKAVSMIVDGCLGIYSYAFIFETTQD